MRNLFLGFTIFGLSLFSFSSDSEAMKLQGRRESKNLIDLRLETKIVNTQMGLETGRRYLIAMMMMAEKNASEHPECGTLGQEMEKIKTVRAELEGMGSDPARRLICSEEAAGSRVNLCAKLLAKDPATAPDIPDLKEFENELNDAYRPAMEQIGRVQASLSARNEALAKEPVGCRAALELIQKKAVEVQTLYSELQQKLQELIKRYN
jgi:hypothetical protein